MLTDLQKRKLTRFFNVFDADHNNVLTTEDPQQVAHNLGQLRGWQSGDEAYATFELGFMQYWRDFLTLSDKDENGEVTLDEWLAYHDELLQNENRFKQIVLLSAGMMFDLIDADGDGSITLEEYGSWMRAFRIDEGDITPELFAKLDLNGDGTLSRAELIQLTTDFYFSNDPDNPGNWCMGPF
ncbi:MAG TPA: EF-hand domain-containing protein [Anaerolineae bacterium]|nr:EF-hand domain-containing protein [Anaerolineae bacterium]